LSVFGAEEVEEAGRFGFEDGFGDFFEDVEVGFGGGAEEVKAEGALSVLVRWRDGFSEIIEPFCGGELLREKETARKIQRAVGADGAAESEGGNGGINREFLEEDGTVLNREVGLDGFWCKLCKLIISSYLA
jgi:hypothetical protein